MRLSLSALALAGMMTTAWAHSWYPVRCCSGDDCQPLPIEAVTEVDGGWRIDLVDPVHGEVHEFVPVSAAEPSRDGNYHACFRPAGYVVDRIRCLFVPLSS